MLTLLDREEREVSLYWGMLGLLETEILINR
jgi:hypothetical protein